MVATNSDDSLLELKRKVTSPNGTTQAALEVLEKNDVQRELIEKAVDVAALRSNEIGVSFGKDDNSSKL